MINYVDRERNLVNKTGLFGCYFVQSAQNLHMYIKKYWRCYYKIWFLEKLHFCSYNLMVRR